jgi:hypothetical protein
MVSKRYARPAAATMSRSRANGSGQRSIRLSRAYRAIHEIREDTARFVSIEEVSKHEY